MDRRQQVDDMQAELENQCYHLFPDRWTALYQNQDLQPGDLGHAFDGEEEIPVTDPEDLDAWYESLAQSRSMSGADLFGYAEGEGIRV